VIGVEYFVGSVVGLAALNYATARLLLREVHALTRALIANNSKELAMLDKAARPTTVAKRRIPEVEADFPEPRLRGLGLG
jgi:hypothetical protein